MYNIPEQRTHSTILMLTVLSCIFYFQRPRHSTRNPDRSPSSRERGSSQLHYYDARYHFCQIRDVLYNYCCS